MENRQIIFQVAINRTEDDFELVKIPINNIEQLALENFLQSYLDSMREQRKDIIEEEYFREE